MLKTIEIFKVTCDEKAVKRYRLYSVRVKTGSSFFRINGHAFLSETFRSTSLNPSLHYNKDYSRIFTTKIAAKNNIKRLESIGLECCLMIEEKENPLARHTRLNNEIEIALLKKRPIGEIAELCRKAREVTGIDCKEPIKTSRAGRGYTYKAL